VRYVAVIVSGMLAALGGAYLSVGFTGTFNENMSAGRGFIALAAVIFGKWNPFGAFGACLLFGFASALSIPLQREADISANLVSTLPYVLTLVALVGVIGRSVGPAGQTTGGAVGHPPRGAVRADREAAGLARGRPRRGGRDRGGVLRVPGLRRRLADSGERPLHSPACSRSAAA
jgi:hypothetical protein